MVGEQIDRWTDRGTDDFLYLDEGRSIEAGKE